MEGNDQTPTVELVERELARNEQTSTLLAGMSAEQIRSISQYLISNGNIDVRYGSVALGNNITQIINNYHERGKSIVNDSIPEFGPEIIGILVANFDGPEQEKYRVTDALLSNLRLSLEDYKDVEVKGLGWSIEETQGSSKAREIGTKTNASIVIWGWYGRTGEKAPLSVHFEVMENLSYYPSVGPKVKGEVQVMGVDDLESFVLQTNLAANLMFLSQITVGLVRYATHDWKGAIACFNKSFSYYTNGALTDADSVYFYRGNAYAYCGNPAASLEDFNKVIEISPKLAQAYVNRANAYKTLGLYNDALADYNEAIGLRENYVTAYCNRGGLYTSLGNYDLALADFEKALKLQGDSVLAYCGRGVVQSRCGKYDSAIKDYTDALRIQPMTTMALINRGMIYKQMREYETAIADFNRAIELEPDVSYHYNCRGDAYDDMGEYHLAVKDISKAIDLQPNVHIFYMNRGVVFLHLRDFAKALEDFNKTLDIDPFFESVYINRGTAHHGQGNFDLAIEDFTIALGFQPRDVDAYVKRAYSYAANAEYERAIGDCTSAIKIAPTYAEAYVIKSFIWTQIGRVRRAAHEFFIYKSLGGGSRLHQVSAGDFVFYGLIEHE